MSIAWLKNNRVLLWRWLVLALGIGVFLAVALVGLRYGAGADKWRIIGALPSPVRQAGKFFLHEWQDLPYLKYRFGDSGLPAYDLRIKPADLAVLNSNIPAEGATVADITRTYVPVQIRYQGKEYAGQMHWRGDSLNHWLYPKKSIRVRLNKNVLLGGKNIFNFIIPEDRLWVGEELNNYRATKLGLLTPDSRFVVVTINGQNQALYWEAEQIRSEFLERNGAAVGDVYGELGLWDPFYTDINYWQKYIPNPNLPTTDWSDLAAILQLLNQPSDQEFYRQVFALIDKETFYHYAVLNIIAGTSNQGGIHNMRWYFDPTIGKFRVLAWDIESNNFMYQGHDPYFLEETLNPLVKRILSNPSFTAERNEYLWQYVKDPANLADDLAYFDRQVKLIRKAVYQDRLRKRDDRVTDWEAQVSRLRPALEKFFTRSRQFFVDFPALCVADQKGGKIAITTRSLAPLSLERVDVLTAASTTAEVTLLSSESPLIAPVMTSQLLPTNVYASSGGKDQDSLTAFFVGEAKREFSLRLPVPARQPITQWSVRLKNNYTGATAEVACKTF